MRLSNITLLFFIFAILGLFFVSQIKDYSTHDRLISVQPRRRLRTLQYPNPHFNKVDANARSTKQANLMPNAYDENETSNEDGEIVYSIDYQGVKTHPSPNPKHP
ncbi:uncharacterized protein LOC111913992 [Lactuca sativa]|uniref:Uncharacterized protein n=1 Tax=Lactuca sativa TaxID=4236 RepID=A0A9R1UXL5_LACSA|nr:uncharacterized protein LOC111913992 [Lactuca sativa]KAJ0194655.1 hypothetical protein LSAT_V11C700364340 [Lactuca sativa]